MTNTYRKSYEEELIDNDQCPDLVWINTEDGRVDGRCLAPIFHFQDGDVTEGFACEGHSRERLGWLRMSEAEKLAWERHHDEEGF